MGLLTMSPEKCTLCGSCLEECPLGLLGVEPAGAPPAFRTLASRPAEERCIHCGHCVAVCPEGAIMLGGRRAEDFRRVAPGFVPTAEQVTELLLTRRTHRAYLDRAVPRETLDRIIRTATYAPSPHNLQLPKWLVISDRDELRRLGQTVVDWLLYTSTEAPGVFIQTDGDIFVDQWKRGGDPIFRGAPHLVIAYGAESYAALNAARYQFPIRLTYLEIAAHAYGLGTCHAGFLTLAVQFWPPTRDAIGLGEGDMAYDAILLGHPKNRFRRIPPRQDPEVEYR